MPKKPSTLRTSNGYLPENKKFPENKKHHIVDVKKKNSPTTHHGVPLGNQKFRKAHHHPNKTPEIIMPTKQDSYKREPPQQKPASAVNSAAKTKSLHAKLGISQNNNSRAAHHGKHHMLLGNHVKGAKKHSPQIPQLPSNNNPVAKQNSSEGKSQKMSSNNSSPSFHGELNY